MLTISAWAARIQASTGRLLVLNAPQHVPYARRRRVAFALAPAGILRQKRNAASISARQVLLSRGSTTEDSVTREYEENMKPR
jgi:hypothetical protein